MCKNVSQEKTFRIIKSGLKREFNNDRRLHEMQKLFRRSLLITRGIAREALKKQDEKVD